MFRKIAVGDVMTRKFISVSPDTNLLDCTKQFVKQKVNSLLVTDKNKLVGILTQRDVLWTLTKKSNIDLKGIRAIDIATRKVAVTKPSSDLNEALKKMKEVGFRRLPVMSKGDVVGIITLKDILAVDSQFYTKWGDIYSIKDQAEKLKKAGQQETMTEGLCEECNAYSELLKVEGRLLCPDCRDEIY